MFTVSLLAAGTVVGPVTSDPRLLLARESYLTAVVGVWILITLRARRPLLFMATTRFMSDEAASGWHRAWDTSREFRRGHAGHDARLRSRPRSVRPAAHRPVETNPE